MLKKKLVASGLPKVWLLWLVGGLIISLALAPLMLVDPASYQATQTNNIPEKSDKSGKVVQDSYGHLPMSFEPNTGQFDPQVQFMARGSGYSLFLTPGEAVFSLKRAEDKKPQVDKFAPPIPETQPTDSQPPLVLRMHTIDSNPQPQLVGQEELPGKVNYFIGNDPTKWHTDIPTYSQVKYQGLYPGVDMVYYGNQGQLEYDFVVAPGANPDQIRLGYDGVEQLRLSPQGELELQTAQGVVTQHPPLIYQEVDGQRQQIPGSYRILDNQQIGFVLGDYNHARPLTIDPVLVYSSYLTGTGIGHSVAVDSNGNAYLTGEADSNFPTTPGSFQPTGGDIYVVKINAAGNSIIYATYLGSAGSDVAHGIAVDSSGNAYLIGITSSTNFPTNNPFQGTKGGGVNDAFITKLNPTGSALVYSSYLGGSGDDYGNGIAVDGSENAYLTGITGSADFPTTPGSFQPIYVGGGDAFIVKVNAVGSALVYSSYLGGSGGDNGTGIAVDSSGNAFLVGYTGSTDFPTTSGSFQPNYAGGGDTFVTKMNMVGSALTYSSYIGGSGQDDGYSIAVGSSGNAYLTGATTSTNFPTTPSSFQPTFGGGQDVFVVKLNTTGDGLVYSSYVGGSYGDEGRGIAVDSVGNAYLTGSTYSTNFPINNPFQAGYGGNSEGFVVKMNVTGTGLIYSSYLGGSYFDTSFGIAVDNNSNVYLTGQTRSNNFPVYNPIQANNSGSSFITKISGDAACPFTLTSSTDDGSGANCGTLSFALKQAIIYSTPVTITLPSQITFTGPMPVVTPTATITLAGICTDNNGRGTPGSKLVAGNGAGSNALILTNNMVLSGVSITGFSGYALNITGNGNTVSCSWLGTADGSTAAANGGGVRVVGSNNKLGLPNQPLSGNLISGNSGLGIQVESGSKGNIAYYTLIGYQADGQTPLKNSSGGIKVLAGGQLKFWVGNKIHK